MYKKVICSEIRSEFDEIIIFLNGILSRGKNSWEFAKKIPKILFFFMNN